MNFFAYGTLMNPKVWENIVDTQYKSEKAFLKGYARRYLKGEEYPGIIFDKHSVIEGVLYYDLNTKDKRLLDIFEGEYYQQITVEVCTMDNRVVSCFSYLLKLEYKELLSDKAWSYNKFIDSGLETFMDRYKGWKEIHKL